MAISDVYEVRDFQLLSNEEILNVYHYMGEGGAHTAAEMGTLFRTQILPSLVNLQSNAVQHRRLQIINLGDLTSFDETATVVTGVRTGERLPAHDAWSFTLRLDTRAVRPGSKRVAGISELDVGNGEPASTDYITLLELYRDKLPLVLSVDLPAPNYVPIVVKRIAIPATPTTKAGYRLPRTDVELVFGRVRAALVNFKISHQTSRGNGR